IGYRASHAVRLVGAPANAHAADAHPAPAARAVADPEVALVVGRLAGEVRADRFVAARQGLGMELVLEPGLPFSQRLALPAPAPPAGPAGAGFGRAGAEPKALPVR